MKAIPTSVKAQFFAMYLGQKYRRVQNETINTMLPANIVTGIVIEDIADSRYPKSYLELRQVPDLTDEEKTTLTQFYYPSLKGSQFEYQTIDMWYDSLTRGLPYNCEFRVADYLRSIGIILPFTYLNEDKKPVTLSVDELIGMEWAQLTPKAK